MRSLLLTVFISLIWTSNSCAVLVAYYDEASFLAGAGLVDVYDFENDAAQWLKSPSYSVDHTAITDFGDFLVDSTSDIYQSQIRDDGANHDMRFNSMSNGGFLNVIFDESVSAFGFNWIADGNQSHDGSTFSIAAIGFYEVLGYRGTSGFFGVVETAGVMAAGTAFTFGQSSTNWSAMVVDNITYSASPTPEPATMLLFGTGLASLIGFRLRKKT